MNVAEETKLGKLLLNPEARAILGRYDASLQDNHFTIQFRKLQPLKALFDSLESDEKRDSLRRELAQVRELPEEEADPAPSPEYEPESVPRASASVRAPLTAERWGVFEIELQGPKHGNPFVDVELGAEFSREGRSVRAAGFYDGDGVYRIRFMPDAEGEWTYRTTSNARSLDGIEGRFSAAAASEGNHGPVRVKNTFHFAYEDGTTYLPFGTTCYVWNHQGEELEERTLKTLASSSFNKMRMCVFPKSYLFNENEPVYYPYEGSLESGWDYKRFNPAFFRHLERRIQDLGRLGVEADLILFHAYDRWGFSEMGRAADDRYLRYVTARLAAFRNVWWSLANEYDLMWQKEEEDWERFGSLVTGNDPYGHLTSIHNCGPFYDHGRPWITHSSIQRQDVYRTSEYTDEWRKEWNKPVVIDECAYEGNIGIGWGNIPGEEMTRRFWEGAVRGGYVGHGETYVDPDDILWWSKGGELRGTSPERIAFLRRIQEEGPAEGWNPVKASGFDWDVPVAGTVGEYLIYYFGFNQPAYRDFNLRAGDRYTVDVIDTWNMTVDRLDGTFEGSFRVELPGRQYIAVRLIKA